MYIIVFTWCMGEVESIGRLVSTGTTETQGSINRRENARREQAAALVRAQQEVADNKARLDKLNLETPVAFDYSSFPAVPKAHLKELAVVGRCNIGKTTLLNTLIGSDGETGEGIVTDHNQRYSFNGKGYWDTVGLVDDDGGTSLISLMKSMDIVLLCYRSTETEVLHAKKHLDALGIRYIYVHLKCFCNVKVNDTTKICLNVQEAGLANLSQYLLENF